MFIPSFSSLEFVSVLCAWFVCDFFMCKCVCVFYMIKSLRVCVHIVYPLILLFRIGWFFCMWFFIIFCIRFLLFVFCMYEMCILCIYTSVCLYYMYVNVFIYFTSGICVMKKKIFYTYFIYILINNYILIYLFVFISFSI